MTKDLTYEILEYLAANNVDFNFIDIKTPFLSILNSQEQKANYRKVLKNLKKDGLISIDGDYTRINAIIPGEYLSNSFESAEIDFPIADSMGPQKPYPLNSLKIEAHITTQGVRYFNSLKEELQDKHSNLIDHEDVIMPALQIKILRNLFKNSNAYDNLMSFMSNEGLVSTGNSGIIWKGFKWNRKYDVSAFYEALFLNDYLKNKERHRPKELSEIMMNSFIDFKITTKTISNVGYDKVTPKFIEMLSRFSQWQQKAS